jgi:hypothetical protein
MNPLRDKAVEQKTLSSPWRMGAAISNPASFVLSKSNHSAPFESALSPL